MDLLKAFINMLIGFLAPDKKEVLILSAKKRAIKSLKKISENHYAFVLSGVAFEIKPNAWSMARGAKFTILQVLKKVKKKSFKVLDLIAIKFKPGVSMIGLSSLYRPGGKGNVHTLGRGVDIGYIVLRSNGKKLRTKYYDNEPVIFKNIRYFAYCTGLIWQWIGPNKIRLSINKDWVVNNGSEGLHKDHRDHIHLTVST